MYSIILSDIKYKLTRYYEKGFENQNLIILIPTRFFNILVGYIENDIYFTCEKPTDNTGTKSYIWGIEIKRVDDLDDVYVSLK